MKNMISRDQVCMYVHTVCNMYLRSTYISRKRTSYKLVSCWSSLIIAVPIILVRGVNHEALIMRVQVREFPDLSGGFEDYVLSLAL
jgi:hypothetical protein